MLRRYAPGKCGYYLDSSTAPLVFATDDDPLNPGIKAQKPGCCRPEGTCGVLVDLTTELGASFGCVAVTCNAGTKSCVP